jgi:hypothetical protein
MAADTSRAVHSKIKQSTCPMTYATRSLLFYSRCSLGSCGFVVGDGGSRIGNRSSSSSNSYNIGAPPPVMLGLRPAPMANWPRDRLYILQYAARDLCISMGTE